MIETTFYCDRDKYPLSLFKLKLDFLSAWGAQISVNNTRQQGPLADQDMPTGKNTARPAGYS